MGRWAMGEVQQDERMDSGMSAKLIFVPIGNNDDGSVMYVRYCDIDRSSARVFNREDAVDFAGPSVDVVFRKSAEDRIYKMNVRLASFGYADCSIVVEAKCALHAVRMVEAMSVADILQKVKVESIRHEIDVERM